MAKSPTKLSEANRKINGVWPVSPGKFEYWASSEICMAQLTPEQIQSAFDDMGLGTDAQRTGFRELAIPLPLSDETYGPVRLDIGSFPTFMEDPDAKLAPVARRDQGKG